MYSSRISLVFILIIISIFCHAQSWHKTQIGTGKGNCGPATVAMSILWSTGEDYSVKKIRSEIGYTIKNGATRWLSLLNTLHLYKVEANIYTIKDLEDLKKIVNYNNSIVIIKIDMLKIPIYKDAGSHYIIIYDLFANLFAVADPLNNPDIFYSIYSVWSAIKDMKIIRVYK